MPNKTFQLIIIIYLAGCHLSVLIRLESKLKICFWLVSRQYDAGSLTYRKRNPPRNLCQLYKNYIWTVGFANQTSHIPMQSIVHLSRLTDSVAEVIVYTTIPSGAYTCKWGISQCVSLISLGGLSPYIYLG